MIKFEEVSKIYKIQDVEIHALKHINLEIRKGKSIGVIGESRAGKTTLLRLMSAQEMPTEGQIWWEKSGEAKAISYHTRVKNKKVAVLFHDYPVLWSKTVEQNIFLLLEITGVQKQAMQRRLKSLLKKVQLEGMEKSYLSELDGLQRQKLALACVLIQEPEVLLCDETRLRLDPAMQEALFRLIEDLQMQHHLTVVYFTYRKEFVEKYCSEVIVLRAGEIIDQGEVNQVFQKGVF